MRPLRLHGVLVDLCFACGGLWLDGGELRSLTAGRHLEVGGTTPPTLESLVAVADSVVGDDVGPVRLGRGSFAVLFSQPDSVGEAAVARAFAGTDGLTAIDARLIVGGAGCVVVEGVSLAGARGLVRGLLAEGIVAETVADDVLKTPVAITAQTAVIEGDVLLLGFHTGPSTQIAVADVVGIAAGVTRVERPVTRSPSAPFLLRRLERRIGTDAFVDDKRVDTLISEVLVVEALIVDGLGPRRLRVSSPPVRRDVLVSLVSRCQALGVPMGRCRTAGAGTGWPIFNRPRDIERDAVWAAWRAARWPAA